MISHKTKLITSKISNFLWSIGVLIVLGIGGWWIIQNWVVPWFGHMDTTLK